MKLVLIKTQIPHGQVNNHSISVFSDFFSRTNVMFLTKNTYKNMTDLHKLMFDRIAFHSRSLCKVAASTTENYCSSSNGKLKSGISVTIHNPLPLQLLDALPTTSILSKNSSKRTKIFLFLMSVSDVIISAVK